ncbi:hypothetical protein BDZ89DRAFT_1159221 [Hymenopellis radicata]|nr:hypothetical protein BDZ89DRAFT_1159221 [Hymenopellis radicata]
MALRDIDSAFIAAFLSTLLYGAYLVVAFQCSELLYHRFKARRNHWYLTCTHCVLFILISIRCISVMARVLNGLVHQRPDGSIELGGFSSAQSLLVGIPWMLIIVISDLFIIYRAYVVTKKRLLLIVIPLLLMMGDFASGIWLVNSLAKNTDDNPFIDQLSMSIKLFCSFTVAINLICSGLIAWRLLSVRKNVTGLTVQNDSTLTNLVTTIVESAALWTAVSLCIVITTFLGSYVNYILIDLCPPLAGLVFSNIMMRVSRGQSYGDTNSNTNSGTRPSRTEWSGRPADPTETSVQIRLDRIVHTRGEDFETSKIGMDVSTSAQETASVETPSVYDTK